MKLLVYDFEIFKYDHLLGIIDLETDKVIQIWGDDNIRLFINEHLNDIWIGHNNIGYDELILEACLMKKNLYNESKKLINSSIRPRSMKKTFQYDTMYGIYSLKTTELVSEKNISESPISFDIQRQLTDEEKTLVESYNKDDLNQTKSNFFDQLYEFEMRIAILKEFNVSLKNLSVSGTKLAAIVLGAKKIPQIEDMPVRPKMYDTLKLKNQAVIDFYMNEDFRKNKKLEIMLCGCIHYLGAGGIHAAKKKCYYSKALYFDVSGYYNLIMINYNLLPRTLPQKSREMYINMYHEQLRLKSIDPFKRQVYKTILLSVFGAMMNKYTDFYDPWNGLLVTITGQIFLVDLLEKLEGKVDVIQSNTDGIMVDLKDWSKKDEVIDIVNEWETRTGFVIKKEEIHDLWQRDVNNYFYRDSKNEPYVKGEAVRGYWLAEKPVLSQLWNLKEPAIIAKSICDFFLYNIKPEETIENELHKNLLEFMYVVKKLSYDYCQYEEYDNNKLVYSEILQNVNRAFAFNNFSKICTITKYKNQDGKIKKTSVSSLPDNIFVWNKEMISENAKNEIISKIDKNWYINRAYERIKEFIPIVGDIKVYE